MTSQIELEMSATDRRTMTCSHLFGIRSVIVSLTTVAYLLASDTAVRAQFIQPVYGASAVPVSVSIPVCGAACPQTACNSYANGVADMIRAEGEYNLKTAQAQLAMENVQAKQLINRTNAIRNHYQMKDEWHARQDANRELQFHRAAPESVAHAPRSNAAATPESDAFDPDTGRIAWPKALLGRDYSAQRTDLDRLLLLRAESSGRLENVNRILSNIQEMTAQLKHNIASLPAGDYMQARKFLDRLASTVNHG